MARTEGTEDTEDTEIFCMVVTDRCLLCEMLFISHRLAFSIFNFQQYLRQNPTPSVIPCRLRWQPQRGIS